ncbi:MAG: glycogen synthase GlgA [Candidatus Zixiibacteriota bacterium]
MAKLRILEIASEAAPYVRSGGLGDVLGALPKALCKLGNEVKVFIPKYGAIDTSVFPMTPTEYVVPIISGGRQTSCSAMLIREPRSKMEFYFVENDYYFNRNGLYVDSVTGKDFPDNDERFICFNKAVLELVKRMGWRPDVIHVHDWQAALVPVYLKSQYAHDPILAGVPTVLTIHNLGYQGIFEPGKFMNLGLPDSLFYAMTGPFEFFGKVNFLKAGLMTANKLTTVSPRYAREIQSSDEFGCGLQGVLQQRTKDLDGILNGVDYTIWSPSRDRQLQYHYTTANLSGKKKNKVELLAQAGMPFRDKAPLIGVISRMTDQKGWDLIAEAAETLFARNVQMIVLGTGDAKYQTLMSDLETKYPDKVRTFVKFDDALAHKIEAASDIFLMPSRWEPCGLNQLYSLKYGTVPVVREVGGLADTVTDFDPVTGRGTGFVFKEYKAAAMLKALDRAIESFGKKRVWTKIVKAGMLKDFSWDNSARQYVSLFEKLTSH